MSAPLPRPVLLFDGQCGLCHRVVQRLLRADKAGRLHYAPLQGEPAQTYLRAQGLPTADFDSLVFVPDWNDPAAGAYRLRTAGALAACAVVNGGLWRAVGWTRFIPGGMRDLGYRLVARSRHALFGEHRPAPLETPEWAGRFL
jgi:predicted DCC family thiol-disulfide oxidoreductase YuxK